MNVVVLTMAATWVSPRFASGLFWFSVPSLFLGFPEKVHMAFCNVGLWVPRLITA